MRRQQRSRGRIARVNGGVAAGGARHQPAVHRVGIDHQVVAGAVEQRPIDEHHADPLQHAAALDVAGDHPHPDLRRDARTAEQHAHRRLGQHRLDARHHLRLQALVGDLEHDAGEELQAAIGRLLRLHRRGRCQRADGGPHAPGPGPAYQVEQAGQEDVEVVRQQRGAAGRRGDAHIALDDDAARHQLGGQTAKLGALAGGEGLGLRVGIAIVGQGAGAAVVLDQLGQLAVGAVQAQQVADQAAARVRHQVDPAALGQGLDQGERVVDRALREGAMLVAEDALTEAVLQRRPGRAAR